jgi:hypothetical protein
LQLGLKTNGGVIIKIIINRKGKASNVVFDCWYLSAIVAVQHAAARRVKSGKRHEGKVCFF